MSFLASAERRPASEEARSSERWLRFRLTKTTATWAAGPCLGGYNVPTGRSHHARLFIPGMDPQGTGPLIRDLSGKVDLVAKGQEVHVHAAYYVPMPHKGACLVPAAPHAPFHFLFPPACWTPA